MQTANTDIDSLVQQFQEKMNKTESQWATFTELTQNKNELAFNELQQSYTQLHSALMELSLFLVQGKLMNS